MTRKSLALIAALALALSGCLGAHEDDEPLDDHATEDAPEPLHATLDANQTNGHAPLTVAFTLNASTQGPLNWSLHPGDGTPPFTGKTLPSTIEHAYPDPGEYTARLAIDAGERTDDATLTLTVQPPSGANGPNGGEGDDASSDEGEGPSDRYDGPDPVTITGNATLGNPLHVGFCFNQGVDGDRHEISSAQPGWAYQIEPAGSFALYWYAGDAYVEQGGDSGTVPSGADTVEICLTENEDDVSEYELTLYDPAHPDAP